jgi:hypothetical protein
MNGSQPAPPSIVQGPESPEAKQLRKLQMIAEALQLLRDDKLRGFRIDIETDSTVQGDAQEEKAARIEFIEGVTKFIEVGAQVTMQVPEFAPLAAKMLQFAVRGFRVGRDLESAIEDFCEKAEQDAKKKASMPPPPNPEMIKAQSEQMKIQGEIQRQNVQSQADMKIAQMDIQMKQLELQMEQLRSRAEIAQSAADSHLDAVSKMREHALGERQHGQKIELMTMQHNQKMQQAAKPKAVP